MPNAPQPQSSPVAEVIGNCLDAMMAVVDLFQKGGPDLAQEAQKMAQLTQMFQSLIDEMSKGPQAPKPQSQPRQPSGPIPMNQGPQGRPM